MSARTPTLTEPDPITIDPRPCEECGLTIDRHRRVDADEGPEFYCLPANEMDVEELELRTELIRRVEVAEIVCDMELDDPRDSWKHTGELPPSLVDEPAPPHTRPRVAQSTIDAFKYVVTLGDPEYLALWLQDHSDVAADLLKGVG